MKRFLAENTVDYSTYTFNYAAYCVKESNDELAAIYALGYLPYTGNIGIKEDIFYLARSLRVDLDRFEDTSENRRVNRLIEPLGIELEVMDRKSFDADSPDFQAFCQAYIAERIGEEAMSAERWAYILSRETGTHIFRFKQGEKTVGYVLAALTPHILHYWFAFFDTELMRTHSLGKWMMWRLIRWAKEQGLQHVYLGTAYKPSALYKIRDHKGLAFFDGVGWNSDAKQLKEWCQTDLEPKAADRFKLLAEPNDFIEKLG